MESRKNVKCYWIYLVGFVDMFAVSMIVPIIPQYAKEAGVTPSVIGSVVSIYGAVQFISSPMIGRLGDKYGRIHVLLYCLLISAGAYMLSSLCVYLFFMLVIGRCILGIFKHTQDLCRNQLAHIATSIEKTKVIGHFNALSSVGFIIGPTISGVIADHIGFHRSIFICFLMCGCMFVINAIIVRTVVWPSQADDKEEKPVGFNAEDVESITKKTPSIQKFIDELKEIDWKIHADLYIFRFVSSFGVLMYRSSFVLGVRNFYPSLSSTEVGYLLSYNGFLGLVIGFGVSWIFAHKYYAEDEEKLQLHACLFVCFGLLIVAVSRSLIIMMIGLCILAIGTATSRACGITLTVKRSLPDETGKLLGISSSVLSISRSGAPFFAGLAQEVSFSLPVFLSLILSFVSLWFFYARIYCRQRKSKVD